MLIKPSSFHDAEGGVAAAVAALRLAVTDRAAVVSISAAGQTGGEIAAASLAYTSLEQELARVQKRLAAIVGGRGRGPAVRPRRARR